MEGGDHLCGDELEQDGISCILPTEHVSKNYKDTHISHEHIVPNGLSGLIGNIVAIILAMFRWVGIVLLVWGVAQFIMAIKRTDAESKSDAIQTIICSIVLISLKSVIEGLGIDGLTIGSADI